MAACSMETARPAETARSTETARPGETVNSTEIYPTVTEIGEIPYCVGHRTCQSFNKLIWHFFPILFDIFESRPLSLDSRLVSLDHRIITYRMRALSRDRGPIWQKFCLYKSAILDFLQKLPFASAQNVLGRVNFSLINPPFCGDHFLTDRHETGARILCLIFLWSRLCPTLDSRPTTINQTLQCV